MIRNRRIRLFTGTILLAGASVVFAAGTLEVVSRVDPSQYSATGSGVPWYLNPYVMPPGPPSLSADGRYVALVSSATNLVAGQKDVNGSPGLSGSDVFLKDLATGALTLVSHAMSSPVTTGNKGSSEAVVSSDGRYVAFVSAATDLAPGQAGNPYYPDVDVLLFDKVTGTNTLVAFTRDDLEGFSNLAINTDGRFVLFMSSAGDIIPGQAEGARSNLFLYDRVEKTTRLVSHADGSPTTGTGASGKPDLSADGRFIVFSGPSGLQLYDRTSGALTTIGPAGEAEISADGRYIAYSADGLRIYDRATGASTLVSELSTPFSFSADGRYLAYARDARLIILDRASGSSITSDPIGEIGSFRLSGDGRYAVLTSQRQDLVPGQVDTNISTDVFLLDRGSGKLRLVSRSTASPQNTGNALSRLPAISDNGARIAFSSAASNLVSGVRDLNLGEDFFAQETSTGTLDAITLRAPDLPSLTPALWSQASSLSADGRYVAFASVSPFVVAGQVDANGTYDVFLHDRVARKTILASHTRVSAGAAANGLSMSPILSADGRYVAFFSNATNLVPGTSDPEKRFSLYLFDRQASTVVLVARTELNLDPERTIPPDLQMSPDGRWLAFSSPAVNLVPGQQDQAPRPDGTRTDDVFLWDRITGNTLLVSRSTRGPATTGDAASIRPVLSAYGRYVLFISAAGDLVQGQTESQDSFDVFLFDRVEDKTTLVSHAQNSALQAVSGGDCAMTPDGRFIVFGSKAGDLDPLFVDNSGNWNLYLHDRNLGTIRRITGFSNFVRPAPSLSADGRFIAFASDGTPISGIIPTSDSQIYLYDRVTTGLRLVTLNSGAKDRAAHGESRDPVLSTDGRYLAFLSRSDELVSGQTRTQDWSDYDLFFFDRIAGATTLVSHAKTSALTAVGRSSGPLRISTTGRQVLFTSPVDIAEGDLNRNPDAVLFDLDAPPAGAPVPLPSCTLLDTRLRSNLQRIVPATGRCGVPATATKVVVKVTARQSTGKGNLQFFPGNAAAAPAGILRFNKGQTVTGTFTLPLATNGAGTLAVLPFVTGKGTVHAIVEINGYVP
jgi:Tol biopolymer transport system component